MMWCRMIAIALRLAGPDVLAPWRSPLLRWRIETYGVFDHHGRLLTASSITPGAFFRFVATQHRALARFLHWAASLSDYA